MKRIGLVIAAALVSLSANASTLSFGDFVAGDGTSLTGLAESVTVYGGAFKVTVNANQYGITNLQFLGLTTNITVADTNVLVADGSFGGEEDATGTYVWDGTKYTNAIGQIADVGPFYQLDVGTCIWVSEGPGVITGHYGAYVASTGYVSVAYGTRQIVVQSLLGQASLSNMLAKTDRLGELAYVNAISLASVTNAGTLAGLSKINYTDITNAVTATGTFNTPGNLGYVPLQGDSPAWIYSDPANGTLMLESTETGHGFGWKDGAFVIESNDVPIDGLYRYAQAPWATNALSALRAGLATNVMSGVSLTNATLLSPVAKTQMIIDQSGNFGLRVTNAVASDYASVLIGNDSGTLGYIIGRGSSVAGTMFGQTSAGSFQFYSLAPVQFGAYYNHPFTLGVNDKPQMILRDGIVTNYGHFVVNSNLTVGGTITQGANAVLLQGDTNGWPKRKIVSVRLPVTQVATPSGIASTAWAPDSMFYKNQYTTIKKMTAYIAWTTNNVWNPTYGTNIAFNIIPGWGGSGGMTGSALLIQPTNGVNATFGSSGTYGKCFFGPWDCNFTLIQPSSGSVYLPYAILYNLTGTENVTNLSATLILELE